jgi:hypothetical protein
MTHYQGGWLLIAKNYLTAALLNRDICTTDTKICNGGINDKLKPLLKNTKTEILSLNSLKEKVLSFTIKNIDAPFMKALK